MSEITEGLRLGRTLAALADKLLGAKFIRCEAEANAYARMLQSGTGQLIGMMSSPDDDIRSIIQDEIIACGGKTNLMNVLRILRMAGQQLNDNAQPHFISDDWAANFKEKSSTCSDSEFTKLWAQLLAGEANQAGSYSRKTVNVLADMSTDDARLFQKLCAFQLMIHGYSESRMLVVVNLDDPVYASNSVTRESITTLMELGLATVMGGSGRIVASMSTSTQCKMFAHSEGWILAKYDASTSVGGVDFTNCGRELSNLCLSLQSPHGFMEHLVREWPANRREALQIPGPLLPDLGRRLMYRASAEEGEITARPMEESEYQLLIAHQR